MSLGAQVRDWGRMVKFSHSLFALPFALSGAALAAAEVGITGRQIFWIVVAMIGARNAGMGFVQRTVDLLRHRVHLRSRYFLDRSDVHHCNNRIAFDIRIKQCNTACALYRSDVIRQVQYWHRPEQAVNRLHVLRHTECVVQTHVTVQWRKVTAAKHDRVRSSRVPSADPAAQGARNTIFRCPCPGTTHPANQALR